ncbi:MAG: hypothetical protein KKA05_00595, partial [Alphaproteobacteria bacterium]|nr:hypothetical protein [Alphaproteobacteria bacterium]
CGCGTGQEAWSIAMALKNMHPQLMGWHIDIVATDLSHTALDFAAQATYAQFEVQRGLSVKDLLTWFDPVGKKWRVKDDLRRMVSFESFNLIYDEMPYDRVFDIVLFRHVMDDFESDARKNALEKVSDTLADDGFLFLGPGESPAALSWQDSPVMALPENPGLYVLGETVLFDQDTVAQ